MNICVIGAGYVGLVVASCFSKFNNQVICVDIDEKKIENLKSGTIEIYEPNLPQLINSGLKNKNLIFTNDIKFGIENSDICFIAVGTPSNKNGESDLKYVWDVVDKISKYINSYKIIVNKSTVPIGTGEKIYNIIKNKTDINFDVVSNPEFLRQGNAVFDFLNPSRVILGGSSKKALNILEKLYEPIVKNSGRILKMDINSSEMTKYACNCFLALKISFANELSNICDAINADIKLVKEGMSLDERIGDKFLNAGLGYGGSCFPKDIKALINIANKKNVNCDIIEACDRVNINQRKIFFEKILSKFNRDIKNKTFALWGLSFKPQTNDLREAPSIDIINELMNCGAKVNVYDPEALIEVKKIFKNKVNYFNNKYDVLRNANALVICTEWEEFFDIDFDKIKSYLLNPIIFDGRNMFNPENLYKQKIDYYCFGRRIKKENSNLLEIS